MSQKKIVVIGGGTGSFTILSGLRNLPVDITALVNMVDNGGSTGQLRDELGVLPPGDVRQCLVALSQSPETLRELFNYRFPKSTSFAGHSFGNLFLSAFELMSDNFADAVEMAEKVLDIKGRVLPITLENCNLALETYAGVLTGEHQISQVTFEEDERPQLYLQPKATISDKAKEAIIDADMIVIAPGDLYESLAPALLVDGMSEALAESGAKAIYVANLVNKPSKTKNFTLDDYVEELERFAGRQFIDYVLYNDRPASQLLLKQYALDEEYPVIVDIGRLKGKTYTAIGGDFLSRQEHESSDNDFLPNRSFIRHDSDAVAKTIQKLLA